MKKSFVALLAVLLMAGCASVEPKDETRGWTVDQIYASAHEEMVGGNYTRAIKLYETLQARFPYGRQAQQALMEQAYTHYKDSEPELAQAAASRFLRLYPASPSADYLYYLKGLINYNDDTSFLARTTGQDNSERDPKAAREAFNSFKELIARYPDSRYAEDAADKMGKLARALGGHEMHVARYYMKRGAWLAAANRAQSVIQEYANTGHNEEALAILEQAYGKLGQKQLQEDTRRILALNFPQSPYLTAPWEPRQLPWWQFWG